MIELAIYALKQCDLDGPVQIHFSMSPLIPDLRAHQVFLDAGKYFKTIQSHLKYRYLPSTEIFLLFAPQKKALIQTNLEKFENLIQSDQDILVIPAQQKNNAGGLYGVVQIMDQLLGPKGCPWDQAQTHETLKKNLIEEAYEVIDAIDSKDPLQLQEELGDLLLQPVLHAQIEKKESSWDIDLIAQKLIQKLIRRHPHVFGELKANNVEEALENWIRVKQEENKVKKKSLFENIPRSMPALLRASKVAQTAAKFGFEWGNITEIFDKLQEEICEIEEAISLGNQAHIVAELGDLICSTVQIARWLQIDPEEAVHQMVERFTKRFIFMEEKTTQPLQSLSKSEWLTLWNKAKLHEKESSQ